ncbi:hypothetical protein BGZ76_008767, partial [Entomortierella beljakovae]
MSFSQGYIRIEEDIVPELSTVQLRNVANTRPLPSSSGHISRSQVIDSLLPLSKNPWSNVPTLIDDTPHEMKTKSSSKKSFTAPSTTDTAARRAT